MTAKAKELLIMMASKYDQTKDNSLGFIDYMSFPDDVITELAHVGFIVKLNDIVGTIELTQSGYEEAKQ